MRKYEQRELKALVKDGAAVSLNNYSFAVMPVNSTLTKCTNTGG